MITLTRLDGRELVVNADHILTAEPTPDTVLLLSTGLKLMVRESIPDIVERAAAWQRRVGFCIARRPDPEGIEATHTATVLSFPHGVPSED